MKRPKRPFRGRPSRDEWRVADVWDEEKRPIARGTLESCAAALLADETASERDSDGDPRHKVRAYWIGNLGSGRGGVDAQIVKCEAAFHLMSIVGAKGELLEQALRIRASLVRAGGVPVDEDGPRVRSASRTGAPGLTPADTERVAAMIRSQMGEVIARYREAVREGSENPVIGILVDGDVRRDDRVEFTVDHFDMCGIEARAIDDDHWRLVADQLRRTREPGHFAVLLLDTAGVLSVVSVPVEAVEDHRGDAP
jgi:hypothetical protein